MAPSSRDRISVDLHGLKAHLFARARARGVSPSWLVREVLIANLGQSDAPCVDREPAGPASVSRVRLSLRMSRTQADATLAAASRSGVPPGAYVAGLVAGVPSLLAGKRRAEYVTALIASSAALSSLGRDIRHLSSLLRQGNVRAAQEYRERLDELFGEVRGHLTLAAEVLAGLRPRRGRPGVSSQESD
jgi:hypothetical protein